MKLGEAAADIAKRIVGSWRYIIALNIIFYGYIGIQTFLSVRAFDPYPYILLNLGLSYMAMVTGPLIMIAQNRQEAIAQETITRMARMQEHQLHVLQGLKAIIDEMAQADMSISDDIDLILEQTRPHD